MDVIATVEVPVTPEKLFAYISDLVNYESWLEIVHSVKLFDANSWTVELRARLGPFARSKRLRMVRTSCDEPNSVVFERVEKDERRHSSWVLSATVSKTTTGSLLETKLHYSGSLFTGGLLERALADQIKTGREKLIQQLSAN
jgi:carbon monoxide dehydrogenase subunit G